MRLLVTAFEPYGGREVNSSAEIVRRLNSDDVSGAEVSTAILPVAREAGPERLRSLVAKWEPAAVLCLGQAADRREINVERLAVNLMDYGQPDNTGEQVQDELIRLHGPAAYFATVPVRAIVDAITAAGIPVRLSLSAGAFLCNQVFYELMDYLDERDWPSLAGFVHVPPLTSGLSGRGETAGMSLDMMVEAIRIALRVILAELAFGSNEPGRPA